MRKSTLLRTNPQHCHNEAGTAVSIVMAWQAAVELACDIQLGSSSDLVQLKAGSGTRRSNSEATTVADWNVAQISNCSNLESDTVGRSP